MSCAGADLYAELSVPEPCGWGSGTRYNLGQIPSKRIVAAGSCPKFGPSRRRSIGTSIAHGDTIDFDLNLYDEFVRVSSAIKYMMEESSLTLNTQSNHTTPMDKRDNLVVARYCRSQNLTFSAPAARRRSPVLVRCAAIRPQITKHAELMTTPVLILGLLLIASALIVVLNGEACRLRSARF